MSNNDLKHYGILGMKWGVRRNLGKSDVSKRKSKPKDGYLKVALRAQKNAIFHPIRSTIARSKLNDEGTITSSIRRNAFGMHSKNEMQIFNKKVEELKHDKRVNGIRIKGADYADSLLTNFAHASMGYVVSSAAMAVGSSIVSAAIKKTLNGN